MMNLHYQIIRKQKNNVKGWEVIYDPHLEPKDVVVVGFFKQKRAAKQAILYHQFKFNKEFGKDENE